LGQNTPAIAATEAQYAEMWAQDAMAMYGYAGSSAAATQLSPFSQPQQITSPGALTSQSTAVSQAAATAAGSQQSTLSQLISAVSSALQGLASPTSASGLDGILDGLGANLFASGSGSSSTALAALFNTISGADGSPIGNLLNANIWNTIFSSGFYMPGNWMGTAADFAGLSGGQAASAALGDIAAGPLGPALSGPLGAIGSFGNSVQAGLGQAAIVGKLPVPPIWTAAAPLTSPLGSSLGGTPMVAPPPAVAAGMPGVPLGSNMAGQGFGRAIPQYGFRPTFVARPPAAG
jgi:PPE-repeat protein